MKRKLLLIALSVVLVLSAFGAFCGCNPTVSAYDSESLRKSLEKNSIELANDFTVNTKDDLFCYGMELSDKTIDGKGHTITVKGEEGAFGRRAFFGDITNCTIKNLNIVYDYNIKYSNGNFGGLATIASGCTIDNVHITYTRQFTMTGTNKCMYTGGLVARLIGGSKITNCSVTGDFLTQGSHMGGIAAYTSSDSAITRCTFTGSLNHTVRISNATEDMRSDYYGGVGGIAGSSFGSLSGCKVVLKQLYADLNCDRWSSCTIDAGGLVGRLGGKLFDCYIDLTENCDLYFHKNGSSIFGRTLNAGCMVGSAVKGANIKNVYLDASEFAGTGAKFTQNGKVCFDFGKVDTPNLENVYIMGGDMIQIHRFKDAAVTALESSTDATRVKVEWDETLGIDGIVLTYTVKNGIFNYQEAVFDRIVNGSQIISHCPAESVSGDSKTSVYSNEGVNDGTHYIRISVTLNGETANAAVSSCHNKFANTSHSKAVSSYDDIEFNLGENVIGGSSSNNMWQREHDSGKWIIA